MISGFSPNLGFLKPTKIVVKCPRLASPRMTESDSSSATTFPKMWDILSSALKENARNWFIRRAEKKGIPWSLITSKYEKQSEELKILFDEKNNKSMVYPDYYTRPFHGYDTGNLNWKAAMEGEAATLSMAVNYWNNVSAEQTEWWLRGNITLNIEKYIHANGGNLVESLLDVGSSMGISTEYLYSTFPWCNRAVGMDLSPYFISVATLRAIQLRFPIEYIHRNAESPNLDEKFDLVVCTYMLHEVPREPTRKIIKEMAQLVKPGGVFAVVDLDPTKVRNNLIVSQFRKWAFEVTEPHIYEYYDTNMSSLLQEEGFLNVTKVSNDPVNSIWLGKFPKVASSENVKKVKNMKWPKLETDPKDLATVESTVHEEWEETDVGCDEFNDCDDNQEQIPVSSVTVDLIDPYDCLDSACDL